VVNKTKKEKKMKKQTYFVFGILIGIIAVSIQTASAEEFKFVPATTEHIMSAAKAMKADNTLNVTIISYLEKLNWNNIDDLVVAARDVEEAFMYVDIDPDRIVIGLANKKGQIEEKHKFKTDGVYIQLFRKCK
jgi:hypothetical protein